MVGFETSRAAKNELEAVLRVTGREPDGTGAGWRGLT